LFHTHPAPKPLDPTELDPTVEEEAEVENEKAEEGNIKELALSSKEVQENEESLSIASPPGEEN